MSNINPKLKRQFMVKQRITPDFKIENKYLLHPPTHTHEDLNVIQGSSFQLNARQNIIEKKDVNSY